MRRPSYQDGLNGPGEGSTWRMRPRGTWIGHGRIEWFRHSDDLSATSRFPLDSHGVWLQLSPKATSTQALCAQGCSYFETTIHKRNTTTQKPIKDSSWLFGHLDWQQHRIWQNIRNFRGWLDCQHCKCWGKGPDMPRLVIILLQVPPCLPIGELSIDVHSWHTTDSRKLNPLWSICWCIVSQVWCFNCFLNSFSGSHCDTVLCAPAAKEISGLLFPLVLPHAVFWSFLGNSGKGWSRSRFAANMQCLKTPWMLQMFLRKLSQVRT